MIDGNLAMSDGLENETDPIEILIAKYSMEIEQLKGDMKKIPAGISWGILSGRVEAYQGVIDDLKSII